MVETQLFLGRLMILSVVFEVFGDEKINYLGVSVLQLSVVAQHRLLQFLFFMLRSGKQILPKEVYFVLIVVGFSFDADRRRTCQETQLIRVRLLRCVLCF